MAKIKFGAIVTDMRGKVGSQVFSRNKSGAYARSFKVNVLSATPAQITTRNRLAGFSAAWRSLTQEQRDSWQALLEVPMRHNRLIVYKGHYFHSISNVFGDTPENGRLVQLFFFEVPD